MRGWRGSPGASVIDRPSTSDVRPSYPGRPRTLGVSTHAQRLLVHDWTLCSTEADAALTPDVLAMLRPAWTNAVVPGTVADTYRRDGQLDLDQAPDFDALDWWYRCAFVAETGVRQVLCLDGLATLADVWLNGVHLLSSENMFAAHEVDVTTLLAPSNELVIRFRSLRSALGARRARPRWRTKLVEHQQLRWYRTTLLGRMPGWSPPVRAVGPWREVRLEHRDVLDIVRGDVLPTALVQGGTVDASLTLRPVGDVTVRSAMLHVGDSTSALATLRHHSGEVEVRGTLALPSAQHWWPHTHGAQPQYDARVVVDTSRGTVVISLGPIAFRRVRTDLSDNGFAVQINGATVFCRGACWTPPDVVSLASDESTYRRLLTLARDAGMNMIRVGGTMVYESDTFYDLCDELGILVWQDFMFANMDYPVDDRAFAATTSTEAEQVVARLRRHPSLAVWCGNSEVEQQAAMLGQPAEVLSNALFRERLPSQCSEGAPGIPYWVSSPSGGALPFHVDTGVAHYYGVGAYLRPLEDARRSNVRFAAECLAFSNVPEPRAVDALLAKGESPVHSPRWKARVPRDMGAGWDFEDVRDHYLAQLFAVDPVRLRWADMDRYLTLSRVVTGEVMARTLGEWRRGASTCRGALIWFFKDLWSGAGWGVVDHDGRPKAAYYAVKRAMQPLAIALTDEGSNGVHVHIANDAADAFDGELSVCLIHGGATITGSASAGIRVSARGTTTASADSLLGRFQDTAYAYRFGPPGHDIVAATLRDADGQVVAEVVHFPTGMPSERRQDPLLTASATRVDDRTIAITLRTERFAQCIAIDGGDFTLDDNYFHLLPGASRTVIGRSLTATARFGSFAHALNADEGVRIPLVSKPEPAPSWA